jgi:hypothetical protein
MEIGEEARRRRAVVLWGRCYEREGAPPFWPWVQALRAYAATCDPALVRSQLHRQAALVAELVPELRDRVPDLERPTSPRDPGEARFQLFDAVATLVVRAARVKPLVIVLDDLHASDAGSLLLLEFVARELGGAPCARHRHVSRRRAPARPSPHRHARRADAGAPVRARTGAGPQRAGGPWLHRGERRLAPPVRARQDGPPADRGKPAGS